jgi:hypothetical protein
MNMSIVTFTTVLGQDVVARRLPSDDGVFTFGKPLVIEASEVGSNGQVGFSFKPLSLAYGFNTLFKIPQSALLILPIPADDDIADAYVQATNLFTTPEGGSGAPQQLHS